MCLWTRGYDESMRYQYSEWDGQAFPTPESLFPSPKVMQFIMMYGEKALDAMEQVDGDEEKQYIEAMIEAGLLERDEATGQIKLTPRMVTGLEHKALLEIFDGLKQGSREGHATLSPGRSDERTDGSRPYQFGDDLSEIDLNTTLRNAMARQRSQTLDGPVTLPIRFSGDDFEVYHTEGRSDVAVCLLIDQSGSMMRYGRFYHAKRVALGLRGLMRKRFPQDTLDIVGFYSLAQKITEDQLPLVMPKPVTIYDHRVRLRIPLDQAMQNPKQVPLHFTNLHLGLRQARQILSRRGAANKQVFIITDGQPTAHVEASAKGTGDMLHLVYPPSQQTADITLREALLCQQQGIRVATFAITEDYFGMDWVGFVDQLTRLTRGTAFYCASDDLSSTVIESYLSGKKRKTFTG
ncbi:MAG: VWA domain-containing protein [Phycisphaera sp.]|nr:VWA domain-containing protein [Phycisphaera sp.]